MKKRLIKYKMGGDLSPYAMMLQQLIATQNSRTGDTKNAGLGVASTGLSQALGGVAAGSAFGPAGMIAGGAIGLVDGVIQGLRAKKEAEEARKEEKRAKLVIEQDRSNSILRNYPTEGLGVSGYYAMGGDMSTGISATDLPKIISGGYLKHLGNNGAKVVGDSHNEDTGGDGNTGVVVSNKGQKAEIEAGEVVYRGKVYTKSMLVPGTTKTFAQVATELLDSNRFGKEETVRTKSEGDMKEKLYLTKNKGYRNSLKYKDNPMMKLFDTQEQVKAAMLQQAQAVEQGSEMPMGKFGLDLESANKVAPFIDNLTNMLLTNRSVKLPDPILTKAPRLRTKFDTSGIEANINNSEAVSNRVLQDTGSSAVGIAARLGQVRAASLAAKNDLAAQKVNAENQLANQDILATQQNTANNTALLNQYKMLQMQRKDDIATRTSANAANLTEDLMTGQRDKNMQIRDNQTMMIELTKYADTGVLERSRIIEAMTDLQNGVSMDEVLKKYGKKVSGSTAVPSGMNYSNLANSIAKYLPSKI